jgi:hypothetical protein
MEETLAHSHIFLSFSVLVVCCPHGQTVMFKVDINVSVTNSKLDHEGRKVCVDCMLILNGEERRLINNYCPNEFVDRNIFWIHCGTM